MIRRPSRPARVGVAALAAGVLLATGACSDDGGEETTAGQSTGSPTATPSGATARATPSGALTEAQAKTALITEADIEDDWTQVDDAEKWRDTLLAGTVDVDDFLTGKADAADCQRLLDGLYSEDLLGKPSGASALTGFEQDDSRLLYQVAAYTGSSLDDSMDWLKSLPQKCDEFTATGSGDSNSTVQVIGASLPDQGDARQGLEVTVQGTADGAPTTLTLNVGVVRVGDDAITVTAGGPDGGQPDSVDAAVEQGTGRLETVLKGGTPAPSPTQGY
ncbi:hypothetical protein ABZZ79_35230 [Streptomyces sp. NPDC006458]|uniref:hypothetical protein n=1 Tax=Streptomyces sp. NPDC006458 TaxID=3154302 RepID=UPI0033AFCB2C